MALGQVHHMDIVPDPGAVPGGVVVAEDPQLREAADGRLGDVGHEVVGDAVGGLADEAAGVGAHGVEVPQQHHGPLGVRFRGVPEDLLAHVLGPAVGVGAPAGAGVLPQGHLVVPGVDRGGGGEDDPLDPRPGHGPAQGEGGAQVVVVVGQGLLHGLAHRLQPGEMDGAGGAVLLQNLVQQGLVPHVPPDEDHLLAGDLPDPLQGYLAGVAQVVHHDGGVPRLQQLHTGVAADVPGAASDQYVHALTSFTICSISFHFRSMSSTRRSCVLARSRLWPSRLILKYVSPER